MKSKARVIIWPEAITWLLISCRPTNLAVSLTISAAISRSHKQRFQSQDFQLQLLILTDWVWQAWTYWKNLISEQRHNARRSIGGSIWSLEECSVYTYTATSMGGFGLAWPDPFFPAVRAPCALKKVRPAGKKKGPATRDWDGGMGGGNRNPPWDSNLRAVRALIEQSHPDAITDTLLQ